MLLPYLIILSFILFLCALKDYSFAGLAPGSSLIAAQGVVT
jgi:hypothetical protein